MVTEEPDEALGFLEEIEHAFRRMTIGVFRFTFIRLPKLIYEFFQNFFDMLARFFRYAVRVAIRLVRVTFFGAIWGLVVFGPAMVISLFFTTSSTVQLIGFVWAAVGLAGSVWGLKRVGLKRIWQRAGTKTTALFDHVEDARTVLAGANASERQKSGRTVYRSVYLVLSLIVAMYVFMALAGRRPETKPDDEPPAGKSYSSSIYEKGLTKPYYSEKAFDGDAKK